MSSASLLLNLHQPTPQTAEQAQEMETLGKHWQVNNAQTRRRTLHGVAACLGILLHVPLNTLRPYLILRRLLCASKLLFPYREEAAQSQTASKLFISQFSNKCCRPLPSPMSPCKVPPGRARVRGQKQSLDKWIKLAGRGGRRMRRACREVSSHRRNTTQK